MTFCLRVVLLLVLVAGTLGEEGFDLSHALGDSDLTTAKPKEQTKAPEKPKSDGGLDLLDAFGGDDSTTTKPKKPSSGDTGGFGFDLGDALGPDNDPKPDKPAVKPPTSGGGGGSFSDSDLSDIGGGGEYKPDAGSSDGGHGEHPENDHHGGADQPQDPDLPWGQILKMLNANIPEEFYMWMSNFKQIVTPLLERAMNLLQAMP
ncbi:CD99 molecule isoform X4 [Hippoglossus stenolepis]|uniref:CD99 molecule isoform X4 n=1 Tax=Hippoglossus stenolepis TaxID=195615 RepID=UPI001FB013CB|nr:CD99 molecule isoform X4 [Hippoglossus stenolepis]